jgi:hypothetical protein
LATSQRAKNAGSQEKEETMTELIEAVNREFQNLVESYDSPEHPSGRLHDQLSKMMVDRGCTFAKGPMPVYIKPYFIDVCRRDDIIRTTEAITRICDKVTELYYTNPETRPMYYLSDVETELCAIPHGYPGRVKITRNDAFMTDDSLLYVEFNADSPGGPMYSDMQASITEDLPIYQQLAGKFKIFRDHIMPQVLKTLLDSYKDWGGTKEKPKISISAGKAGGTLPEFLAIVEWLKEKGFESTFCDIPDWQYDGKTLSTPGGFVPDIIYRRGWIGDWTHHMDKIGNILAALRDNKVCLVNPLNSILASQKSLLAVLQQPEVLKMLDEGDQRVVRENVPWTRVVEEGKTTDWDGKEVDLPTFLREAREQMVLKPIDQYGGKDVFVGNVMTTSEWDTVVDKAVSGKFVAQKFVDIPVEDLPVLDETGEKIVFQPKKINVNFYAYGGVYTGGVVRSSDSPVINVHKGGGMTPIMFVEGKK